MKKELKNVELGQEVKVNGVKIAGVGTVISILISLGALGLSTYGATNTNSEAGFIAIFEKGLSVPICDEDPQIQMSKGYVHYMLKQTRGSVGSNGANYKIRFKEKNKVNCFKQHIFYPSANNLWSDSRFFVYSNGITDYNVQLEKTARTDVESVVNVRFFFGREVNPSLSTK